MRSVDAILFDLDGTLIDSKRDITLSVHHLQSRFGRAPSTEEEIAGFIGDGVVKLVERAIGHRDPGLIEPAVDYFKEHYRRHMLDNTRLYPGVNETLEHFRTKKMAIVTNKPSRISERIVAALGIADYFPIIIGGDIELPKKPNPAGVIEALNRLGVRDRSRAMMVGDSAQDTEAGRKAGALTCGIYSNIANPTLLQLSKPDFTIHSLPDLTRIVS
jgi:phosphoglycolate phosphatase